VHAFQPNFEWAVRELLGIYRDPARRLKMQQAGMARDYSWDASAREYVKLYESLAAP